MPWSGWIPVNVPGLVAGWAALSGTVWAAALPGAGGTGGSICRGGISCSAPVAQMWAGTTPYKKRTDAGVQHWFSTLLPQGRALRTERALPARKWRRHCGEVWRHGEMVYRGALAEGHAFSRASREDLWAYRPQW